MINLELNVAGLDRQETVSLPIARVLLAGYTGRDRAAVLAHIEELEQLGVAPPPRVPMVYEVSPRLLTTDSSVTVRRTETSGEVEFFLVPTPGGLLVGVGSDHTDRQHEAIDVAESKTLCSKVLSRQVWRHQDVRDHWDAIEIRAWVTSGGQRQLYQQGTLGEFLALDDLFAELRRTGYADLAQHVVFGGTIAALSCFVFGERFECELSDPILHRQLGCAYDIRQVSSGGDS